MSCVDPTTVYRLIDLRLNIKLISNRKTDEYLKPSDKAVRTKFMLNYEWVKKCVSKEKVATGYL